MVRSRVVILSLRVLIVAIAAGLAAEAVLRERPNSNRVSRNATLPEVPAAAPPQDVAGVETFRQRADAAAAARCDAALFSAASRACETTSGTWTCAFYSAAVRALETGAPFAVGSDSFPAPTRGYVCEAALGVLEE